MLLFPQTWPKTNEKKVILFKNSTFILLWCIDHFLCDLSFLSCPWASLINSNPFHFLPKTMHIAHILQCVHQKLCILHTFYSMSNKYYEYCPNIRLCLPKTMYIVHILQCVHQIWILKTYYSVFKTMNIAHILHFVY